MEHHPQYGDIYLVNFDPSIGHEYQKMRPAIVIQSNEQLKGSSLITVMPITSQVTKKLPGDVVIQRDHTNRLWVDSLVKVRCITSFDRSRFVKKVGVVNEETLQQVKSYLRRHFNL